MSTPRPANSMIETELGEGTAAPARSGQLRTTARGPSTADPSVGRRIGRYVVLGRLGRGGMGTVLKAYDASLDRAVALKLLHSGAADARARRLTREAQALAKLSHPNVVHVYEVGTADERLFIAMELLAGATLRQWQDEQPGWRRCVQ
ncbi:MAG: protein kinase, partial [Nannocystaceae bacterium]